MFKLPPNDVNEPQEHSEPTSLTKASGQGSVAAGRDIKAPIFLGNIRDSVVKIYGSWSPWLWVLLLTMLSVTLLILAAVTPLVFNYLSEKKVPTPPNESQFELIGNLDSNPTVTAFTALTVTALAVDESKLWIGTESESQSSQYSLYQLETTEKAEAKPEHFLDVEEKIINLMVDCKGNLWLLLNETGVLVYQPKTGKRSTLLNRKTTNDWLKKNTTHAIASRCIEDEPDNEDKQVEVWLGREGVHTLRYSNDYPSIDTIKFVSPENDLAFTNSQELTDIRALEYVVKNEMLWVANRSGELLQISFKGMLQPQTTKVEESLWSLSQSGHGIVWAGGSEHLIQSDAQNLQTKTIPLVAQNGTDLDNRAIVLAAGQEWVWFGDRCPKESSACWPLGVYRQDHLFPINLERKEVNAIVIDKSGAVWIGTEIGLIFYSES